MKSRFVEKWQRMSADQNHKWSIAPGVLHNLIEEACEEIEKLIAVARAAKRVQSDYPLIRLNTTFCDDFIAMHEAVIALEEPDD